MNRKSKNWLYRGLLSIVLSTVLSLASTIAAEVVKPVNKTPSKSTKTVPTPAPVLAPVEPEKESVPDFNLEKNEIDRVLAVVNREVITAKDLKDRIALVKRQLAEAKRQLPPTNDFVRQVLDKLIEESVIYQEAAMVNFRISDVEFESILNNVLSQRKTTPEEMKSSLEKMGQTYEKYKENLRRDIIITRYRERMVESKVKITDSEVNDYILTRLSAENTGSPIKNNADTSSTPEMLYISQIVVPTKDTDSRQEQNIAKAKAEEIYEKLKSEKDFINFVNRLVVTDKTVKVQDLGYRTLDRLPQIFIDATAKIQPGQLAPTILRTSAGFHIVKLLDKKGGKNSLPEVKTPELSVGQSIRIEQTEVRHLMLMKKAGVADVDLQRKLRNFKSEVDAKAADFGELAKKNSEDKETAPNLGYIGWISVGQTLPEFDAALKTTKPGSITDPFETSYGWHLLQVLNKQTREITYNQQKEYAKSALRQEKLDQAYQDWIRELRDNATIEYRPPFAAEK